MVVIITCGEPIRHSWERQRNLKREPLFSWGLGFSCDSENHHSFQYVIVWSSLFSILQNLRALVAMNESLKSQEQEFKAHCRVSVAWCQQTLNQDSCEVSRLTSPCPVVASCSGAVGKSRFLEQFCQSCKMNRVLRWVPPGVPEASEISN